MLKIIFLCFTTYFFVNCKKDYSSHYVLDISVSSQNDVRKLLELQAENPNVNFWKFPGKLDQKATCLLASEEFELFTRKLSEAQLQYTVKHQDLARELEKENDEILVKSRLSLGGFDLFNYNRHPQINQYLEDLVVKCGENGLMCHTETVALSYEGREMNVLKIGSGGSNKPAIWIDAGIHAREWIAPATAVIIANRLIFMYSHNDETKEIVDSFDWYILPSANPDGYEYSWDVDRFWRKTRSPNKGSDCIGTDPNRNWDFHWMETGASDDPCTDVYAGSHPFSEVETKGMSEFLMNKTRNFVLFLSLHAYSQLWLTPWGYTDDEVPDDYNDLLDLGHTAADEIQKFSGKHYEVGSCALILYPAAGGSFDWAKGVAGIEYSLSPELPDTGEHGFLLPVSQIKTVGREIWLSIRAMAFRVKELKNIQ